MEILTTKPDSRPAPRLATPERDQKTRYRDELETQIAVCSNRKKLEKLKSQCQDLELLVGSSNQLSRNTMNPVALNTLSKIKPNIAQNTPKKAQFWTEALPPNNQLANSRNPLGEISRFDPHHQDCLATEVKLSDLAKLKPRVNQSVQANFTEEQDVLSQTQKTKFRHQKDLSRVDEPEITQIRDNVREAKLREKQLQFENYLKTDFPHEVR